MRKRDEPRLRSGPWNAHVDAVSSDLREEIFDGVRLLDRLLEKNALRDVRPFEVQVVLLDKRRHQFSRLGAFGPPERVRLLPRDPPFADHEYERARLWTSAGDGDDVFVAATRLDVLLLSHTFENGYAIAQRCCALELHVHRRAVHLALELSENVVVSPFEKPLYARHKLSIRVGIRFARTGSGAQLELVVEARSQNAPQISAATAQGERLTQRLYALTRRLCARVRAEIGRSIVSHHARHGDARIWVVGDSDVREAAVIGQPNVVSRLMKLHEVRLKDKRLFFGVRDDPLDVVDPLDERPRSRRCWRGVKIRSDSILQ